MRILLLGDLPPFVLGGAEQQLLLLAQAWREAGNEVLVLGHRTPTGTHAGIAARRILVAYRLGRLLRGITFALSLAWNLMRERGRTDVIYCRVLGESAIVAAAMKAFGLIRAPLVVAPAASGEGVHSDVARLRATRFWPRLRAWLEQVQVFNAISPAIADELRASGLGPIACIANGVRLPEHAQARSAPESHARFWLFCGRMAPQKGVDLLLEAMALPQSGNIPLILAGEGPEESALRAACQRLALADRVSFVGRLSHQELLSTMRRAYALVLPSRYEGLSNAALEALGAGLPVVSTRCGGIDSYLGDGIGWVCEATPASIAAALGDAAAVPAAEWARRSARGRTLAESTFAIEHCAAEHLTLFAQLAAQRAPAPDGKPPGNPRASLPR